MGASPNCDFPHLLLREHGINILQLIYIGVVMVNGVFMGFIHEVILVDINGGNS